MNVYERLSTIITNFAAESKKESIISGQESRRYAESYCEIATAQNVALIFHRKGTAFLPIIYESKKEIK
mgnify:CR=1 FL=1